MQQSPWEANRFAASQEIPCIYGTWNFIPNLQVPATCPYPELPRSSPSPHFLTIHLNIILPCMSGSPQWSHSLRFPHQNLVHASHFPQMHYMPHPSHSSWFYHSHNIGCFVYPKFYYQCTDKPWCLLHSSVFPTWNCLDICKTVITLSTFMFVLSLGTLSHLILSFDPACKHFDGHDLLFFLSRHLRYMSQSETSLSESGSSIN